MDGFVGGDVHIRGIPLDSCPVLQRRHIPKPARLATGRSACIDAMRGLLDRGLAPVAADHVVGSLAGRGKIQW